MTGMMLTSWRSASRRRIAVALTAVMLTSLAVSPPASAVADGLSVSVSEGTIRFENGVDSAGLKGSLVITDGSQLACGVDVQFSLGDVGSWKAHGEGFEARKALCIWRRSTGRLRSVVLDVVHGTWAFSLNGELEGLENPFDLRVAVGGVAGRVSVPMTEYRNVWKYS